MGCIILAKGKFGGDGQPPAKDAASNDIYIEAKVERSGDQSAFRLLPVYARVNQYDNTGFFGSGTPEIAVSVALHGARAGKESAPVALTMFALPVVKAGSELTHDQLETKASYWTAYPAPDAAAKAGLERLASAYKRIGEAEDAKTTSACKTHLETVAKSIPDLKTLTSEAIAQCPEIQEFVLRAVLETQVKVLETQEKTDLATEKVAKLTAATAIADLKKRAMTADILANKFDARKKAYLDAFKKPIDLTPVSIEVQLIESRKGSPFLQAVADALDKSKKDISKALVQELSPVERAKRRAEEEQQTRTNRAAVATAEDNVRLRQAELDDLPATATRADRVRAENALRQAKIAANNAYLADGRGVPYPEAQP
ncbi:MAG: hypothetical protein C6Y20_11130 [Tagaea sp. CACIAM 22H2]|nr:hypothetical protein [Tagaea sp. CACIAM 22H2]